MRSPHYRSVAVSLALAAMMLRALLPDGWMPAATGAALTICSVTQTSHDGKLPAPQDRSHAPCAFAAAAPLAPPSLSPIAFRPSTVLQRFEPFYRAERAGSPSIHRSNLARAPPAFA